MRDNNILVRHIKPAAKMIGLPWINWQVLRRSFAMCLKMKGADVKDAQALMRHSKASTTMDVYMQFDSGITTGGRGSAGELSHTSSFHFIPIKWAVSRAIWEQDESNQSVRNG